MVDTKKLTQYEVVTLVLASLGGADRSVHTEEIAERAHSVAPDMFSWQMPQFRSQPWPDKLIVRWALVDARKTAHGSLVDGQCKSDLSKDGWSLTETGAAFAQERLHQLEPPEPEASIKLHKLERQRILKRVRTHGLYRSYTARRTLRDANPYDFRELLDCGPNAPTDLVAGNFSRLRAKARLIGDPELIGFLDACAEAFAALVSSSAGAEDGMEGDE